MPHIRTQVPSPLVGEGKGEGAYGNTTTGQALTPTLSRFVGEGEKGRAPDARGYPRQTH